MNTNKPKFYIEFWSVGDETRNVEANTFHIKRKHLAAFIKSFMDSGKYVVHLEMIEPMRKVIYSKRLQQHVNSAR